MAKQDIHGETVSADDLTWREHDILFLLSERLTNREIADRLHLAESTVKDYVGKIISKLYVKNRRQAVERAKELGILKEDGKSSSKQRINLPVERTPFVGRVRELAEIKKQLAETRLLTLTGPGGIGKTRLAVKAGEHAVGDFENGCYFVPLAPIRSVDHIIQTIAESIKFPFATNEDPKHQLLRYLKRKNLLLVVDNFEHLLEGAAIISEILQAAPEVKVLTASRERLNLQSETVLNIGGLIFHRQDNAAQLRESDAVTLFVQSAGKVRPGFNPSAEELALIEKICQMVEGMPLAIELAAAWLQILQVADILAELENGLDILAADVRDAPERHRSIRAVFEYSWSLMIEEERQIFMRLSVFRGGFTREAAQSVAGASLPLLAGLVNKSILGHDPDSGRLEIHELLRQYAQEQLGETPKTGEAVQDAHAAYFAEFIQHREELLRGPHQMLALVEIEADIENIRAAWRSYLDQKNAPQIRKFCIGLWHLCWIRWWNLTGMQLFEDAVRALQDEEAPEAAAVRAVAQALQGYFMAWLGIPEQGYTLAKEAEQVLQQFNLPVELVFAYDSLTVNAYMMNRYQEELQAINKLLEIASQIGDRWLMAFALFGVSMGDLIVGDYPKAKKRAEENLTLYQDLGDSIGSTMPLIVLGHVALACGELEQAREYYLRCLKIAEQVGFHYSTQTATKYLGKVAVSLGKIDEAENYLTQSLIISKEIGFFRDMIRLIYEFGRLRAAQGMTEKSVELLVMAIRHPASDQFRWLEGYLRENIEESLARQEVKLSTEEFAAAVERGKQIDLDSVVADLIGSIPRK